jgi:hypothetical protein
MQGIYNYMPGTKDIFTVYISYSVVTISTTCNVTSHDKHSLLYIGTFRSTRPVPRMAVVCSFSISCFHGMLLRYFLKDFEMVPVVPVITGIL